MMNISISSIYPVKFLFCVLLFFTSFLQSFAEESRDERSHYVLVSVSPHKFFVEQIAGGTVKVGLMVPAGASAHTFEPAPRQMMEASRADIWFRIGEGFEARAIAALKSHNARLKIIDLRQNLNLISFEEGGCRCSHHHESCDDLHFWLSPRLAKVQGETIAAALSEVYPEHAEEYSENLKKFVLKLEGLDGKIKKIMEQPHNSVMMVSHPAYAYFCRDYGCTQLSIEFEGKDPTPHQLTRLLNEARQAHIQTIFIQMQYPSKGARLIANQLGLEVMELDPYAENYVESLLKIAQAIASQSP